ncbi:MAG: MBL fold metallo-hydrolase [Clostridiales bacterium]|jgi:phosphoribosyl 1,2-cyclic phosphodiesterase|nr:MBL fold metallo-hydrolase [Clostridiales bacterium]
MHLHFIGTGAADWNIAAPSADRIFRRFSSLIINGELLVDPGPCVFEYAGTFNKPDLLAGIKYIVNTHPHSDHFCPDTVRGLGRLGAGYIVTAEFIEVEFGRYKVTAVPANHETAAYPTNLIIDDGEKMLFYGLDGAWLPLSAIREIRRRHFAGFVFDGTLGTLEGDGRIFEHNNFGMIAEMKKALTKYADRFFVSHIARCAGENHDVLAKALEPSGIELAFDGFETDI